MASRWVDAARRWGAPLAWSKARPGSCVLLLAMLSAGLASAEQPSTSGPVAMEPTVPAPATPAHSKAERFVRTVGSEGRGVAGRSYGARMALGFASASGSAAETALEPDPSFGGGVYERGFGIFSGPGLSVRYFDELWFGGDTRDLSYALDLDLAVGPEFRLAEGLYLRLRPSFRGTFRNDAGLFLSSLRFPGGESALGVVTPEVELDLALHGALNLLGYYDGFGIHAPLGGGAYGASVSATFWGAVPLRLDLDADVYVPRQSEEGIELGNPGDGGAVVYRGPDAGVAVDATAHACAHLWSQPYRPLARTGSPSRPTVVGRRARDYRLSACVDFRYSRFSHELANSAVLTPGISLVFGKASRLDPHGKP